MVWFNRIIAPVNSGFLREAVTPAAPPGVCRPPAAAHSASSPVSSQLQRSFIWVQRSVRPSWWCSGHSEAPPPSALTLWSGGPRSPARDTSSTPATRCSCRTGRWCSSRRRLPRPCSRLSPPDTTRTRRSPACRAASAPAWRRAWRRAWRSPPRSWRRCPEASPRPSSTRRRPGSSARRRYTQSLTNLRSCGWRRRTGRVSCRGRSPPGCRLSTTRTPRCKHPQVGGFHTIITPKQDSKSGVKKARWAGTFILIQV